MNNPALKQLYNERIKPYLDRFDAMEKRQRILISALVIGLVVIGWSELIYGPEKESKKKNTADIEELDKNVGNMDIQIQKIKEQGKYDPNEELRQKREQLQKKLVQFDEELDDFTVDNISPTQMVFALEEMLNRETELVLDSMESEQAEPVVKSLKDIIASERKTRNMYRHGIVMKFQGDYLSTLNYLKLLEELRWDFFWDDLQYEVTEYPKAKVMIRLHTLSDKESLVDV